MFKVLFLFKFLIKSSTTGRTRGVLYSVNYNLSIELDNLTEEKTVKKKVLGGVFILDAKRTQVRTIKATADK